MSSYISDTTPARGAGPDSQNVLSYRQQQQHNKTLKAKKYIEDATVDIYTAEMSAMGFILLEPESAINLTTLYKKAASRGARPVAYIPKQNSSCDIWTNQ